MIYNGSSYNENWKISKLAELGTFARGVSKHRPRNDPKLFENGKGIMNRNMAISGSSKVSCGIQEHCVLLSPPILRKQQFWLIQCVFQIVL